MLGARSESRGNTNWKASTDISAFVNFYPASGTLAPNHSTRVTISGIPCQSGIFTFLGEQTATPVTISWKCIERLAVTSQTFQLTVHDINGLLNNSQSAIEDIKQQVRSISWLNGHSVGLAIVYTGAPDIASTPQAQNISRKVYDVLKSLGQEGGPFQRASYYDNLYKLGSPANAVYVEVLLYTIHG